MGLKTRARLVCVQCHLRKIRCDLQESRDSSCESCRRSDLRCIRRQDNRKSRVDHVRRQRSNIETGNTTSPVAILSTTQSWPGVASQPNRAESEEPVTPSLRYRSGDGTESNAYIAEHSILGQLDGGSPSRSSAVLQADATVADDAHSRQLGDWKVGILKASCADAPPKRPLRQALFDAFFASRGYTFPFITRYDVEAPGASVLLQQAVCLVGSLTRHPQLSDAFIRSQTFYQKVKLLLALDVEADMMAILKTLCLLTLWSPTPSTIPSLSEPWHAAGTAMRLAMQLGMHRKCTYTNKPNAPDRRKLWWFLYSSDRVLALLYGRPPMLKQADFDVPALDESDFETMDINSMIFLADVRIAHIMGEVASKVSNTCSTPLDQRNILNLLSGWISQLPLELSLYAVDGSRAAYHFAISEIHIEYLATLIISQALYRHLDKRWPCSTSCLVASTCIAKLYEEILCREDVSNISNLHAFLCLTAAIPLLYYRPVLPDEEKQRREDLSVLHSVIDLQKSRYGLAQTVARKLDHLECARRDNLLRNLTGSGPDALPPLMTGSGEDAAQLKLLFPQLFTHCSVDGFMADNIIAREVIAAMSNQQEEVDLTAVNASIVSQSAVDAMEASAFLDSLFDDFPFACENGFSQGDLWCNEP